MTREKIKKSVLLFFILLCISLNIVVISAKIIETDIESKHLIYERKESILSEGSKFYYENRYALLIIGKYGDNSSYRSFTKDAQETYNILNEKYNFDKDNIFLLLTLKDEWKKDLKINLTQINYDESKDMATKENIINMIKKIKTISTDEDLLFIEIISHGGRTPGTFFSLEKNEQIYDYELRKYTKELTTRRTIFILQPCFSGGFINDLAFYNNNVVTITSCRENQPSKKFLGPLNKGLNGKADKNDDGVVTLEEVYEYTSNEIKVDSPLIKPLIDDNGDGIGHYINDYGYNPQNKNKDSFVSARICNLEYEENLNDKNIYKNNIEYKNLKNILFRMLNLLSQ